MKIIGGKDAGFSIKPPKNLIARPTTAIAKESLFNILNNRYHFDQLKVLDLFAGSGSIGLEFASREAISVTAVDSSPITINFLKEITAKLGYTQYNIIKGDAIKYLQKCTETFDIIFADPPYAMQDIESISTLVFENKLLNPNGILIMEHDKHVRLSKQNLQEERKYGHSQFSFYSAQL